MRGINRAQAQAFILASIKREKKKEENRSRSYNKINKLTANKSYC
jgi:hypothetical protein